MFGDFYGFTGKPFQLTPDPALYFQGASHRKALSYLGYGLTQGEGFVVITGEAGTGKSILAAHLAATIDPRQLTAAQAIGGKLDEEEMVCLVAQSFGLGVRGHSKAGALGVIERFLYDEARAGRRCLLIVDEAQHLPLAAIEELRMLANFQLGGRALLQVLLLGLPEFRTTLQGHPRLEQRVIAADHLEPLGQAEIEPYVVHRLKLAGWDGDPKFDKQVFAGLFEASSGIPRHINQIANRLLLLGAVEQSGRIDAALLKTVLDEMAAEKAIPQATVPETDLKTIDQRLAERDAQIAMLRAQLARLEGKAFEHERTIRHTLEMLIDWIEGETEQTKAA